MDCKERACKVHASGELIQLPIDSAKATLHSVHAVHACPDSGRRFLELAVSSCCACIGSLSAQQGGGLRGGGVVNPLLAGQQLLLKLPRPFLRCLYSTTTVCNGAQLSVGFMLSTSSVLLAAEQLQPVQHPLCIHLSLIHI